MPYYTKDPKRDHNFDNHPYAIVYLCVCILGIGHDKPTEEASKCPTPVSSEFLDASEAEGGKLQAESSRRGSLSEDYIRPRERYTHTYII